MATFRRGGLDGRRDRRRSGDLRGTAAGAAAAGAAAADHPAAGDAATGRPAAADDAAGESGRPVRRSRRCGGTRPRHAAAAAARSTGGDAGAREADRLGDRADAGSARRTEAWLLGCRTGGVEPAHGLDHAVRRRSSAA